MKIKGTTLENRIEELEDENQKLSYIIELEKENRKLREHFNINGSDVNED